jgi:Zn-dependent protease
MLDRLTLIQQLLASLPAFLLAIVLHEVAHGYTASLLGDDTAKRAGRLTLSPIAHLDPVGTIFFVFSTWAGIGFGWAKPVPVAVDRLRNPRRDDILVTLAGPTANLLQAAAWALILRFVPRLGLGDLGYALALVCYFGVAINVLLMLFNLLPIPPLDGSHIALRLLGSQDPHLAGRLAPLGFVFLFLLVGTPLFDIFYRSLFAPILRLFLPGGF